MVNTLGNGGTENIIKIIKQGGNNSINLNIYLFDCIDSSIDSNTNSVDFNSFDFDCVDFNINSLKINFCTKPKTNFTVTKSETEASINFPIKKQSNFLVKGSMNFPVKKQPNF